MPPPVPEADMGDGNDFGDDDGFVRVRSDIIGVAQDSEDREDSGDKDDMNQGSSHKRPTVKAKKPTTAPPKKKGHSARPKVTASRMSSGIDDSLPAEFSTTTAAKRSTVFRKGSSNAGPADEDNDDGDSDGEDADEDTDEDTEEEILPLTALVPAGVLKPAVKKHARPLKSAKGKDGNDTDKDLHEAVPSLPALAPTSASRPAVKKYFQPYKSGKGKGDEDTDGDADEDPNKDTPAFASTSTSKPAVKKRGRPSKSVKGKEIEPDDSPPKRRKSSRPPAENEQHPDGEPVQKVSSVKDRQKMNANISATMSTAAESTDRPSRAAAKSAKASITAQSTTKQLYTISPASQKRKTAKPRTNPVFEVERIVDRIAKGGKTVYCIKWLNYPSKENTWEPAENLAGCQDLVRAFDARADKKGKGGAKSKGKGKGKGKAK